MCSVDPWATAFVGRLALLTHNAGSSQIGPPTSQVRTNPSTGTYTINARIPGAGDTFMNSIFDPGSGQIRVSAYAVDEAFQGKCLSTSLFQEVIARAQKIAPVTELNGTPFGSNLDALQGGPSGPINPANVANTPWAKRLADLGFDTSLNQYNELTSRPQPAPPRP